MPAALKILIAWVGRNMVEILGAHDIVFMKPTKKMEIANLIRGMNRPLLLQKALGFGSCR